MKTRATGLSSASAISSKGSSAATAETAYRERKKSSGPSLRQDGDGGDGGRVWGGGDRGGGREKKGLGEIRKGKRLSLAAVARPGCTALSGTFTQAVCHFLSHAHTLCTLSLSLVSLVWSLLTSVRTASLLRSLLLSPIWSPLAAREASLLRALYACYLPSGTCALASAACAAKVTNVLLSCDAVVAAVLPSPCASCSSMGCPSAWSAWPPRHSMYPPARPFLPSQYPILCARGPTYICPAAILMQPVLFVALFLLVFGLLECGAAASRPPVMEKKKK